MSDTNNTTIRFGVDASGVQSGVNTIKTEMPKAGAAFLDAGKKAEMMAQAITEAANNNVKATERQVNSLIGRITQYTATVGKSRADLLSQQAAQMGMSESLGPLIAKMREADAALQSVGHSSRGVRTEMMRIGFDAARGDYGRLAGSAMELGEQFDIMGKLAAVGGFATVGALAAVAASVAAVVVGMEAANSRFEAFIARARFVGYFEVGKHEDKDFNDPSKTKLKDKVELAFELSGPNHPPRDINGEKAPQRIAARENYELREDSKFADLFRQMNHAGKATHIAELLGEPFLVEIFHRTSKDGRKTFAMLDGPWGYNIMGTAVQDPVSGQMVTADVPPMTDLKAFIWDYATRDAWDSIYIAGEYAEQKDEKTGEVTRPAKSKNVLQDKIMSSKNWPELAARLGLPPHESSTTEAY